MFEIALKNFKSTKLLNFYQKLKNETFVFFDIKILFIKHNLKHALIIIERLPTTSKSKTISIKILLGLRVLESAFVTHTLYGWGERVFLFTFLFHFIEKLLKTCYVNQCALHRSM